MNQKNAASHLPCCSMAHLTVCGASSKDDRVEPQQAEAYRAVIAQHLPTKDVPRNLRLEAIDVRGQVIVVLLTYTLVQDLHRYFGAVIMKGTLATSLAMSGLLVLSSTFPCDLACWCIAQNYLVPGLHAASALCLQHSDCEAVQQLCMTCMNTR